VPILVGWVLARRFDFGRHFWDGLEKLVYYVLFPALLFRSLAVAKIDLAATAAPVAVGLGSTLVGNAAIASTPISASRSREASSAPRVSLSRRSSSAR
jgi:predicted permease